MPALSCSAMTCVYNQNELCSKGDIRVGGSGAKSSMETCCESFKERGEGTMSNSTGCGCTKIGVDCKAQNCTFNDNNGGTRSKYTEKAKQTLNLIKAKQTETQNQYIKSKVAAVPGMQRWRVVVAA